MSSSSPLSRVLLAFLPVVLALAGCGDDQDPGGASDLWTRLHEQGYQGWSRAPGYEGRRPTDAPHGDEVEIFVNPAVVEALGESAPVGAWPVGSIIAKDGYEGGDLSVVAAMEKLEGGWFWAEWDADGESVYSGNPELCTGCHESGADMVRAFGFSSR